MSDTAETHDIRVEDDRLFPGFAWWCATCGAGADGYPTRPEAECGAEVHARQEPTP